MPLTRRWPPVPQHQPRATLMVENPTSGVYYTVLPTTRNARLIAVEVAVYWTAQPTNVKIRITIDGNVIVHQRANPLTTQYYFITNLLTLNLDTVPTEMPFLYEGRSIKVEVQFDGGTATYLDSIIEYAKFSR